MRPLPLVLAGTLAILAGCGDGRSAALATAPAAAAPIALPIALPIDLLGTWTSQAGGGFIAFGARQVVIAVEGSPRLVAAPLENAIEPGMSAGRLGLAGGTALFLARGSSAIAGLPVDHLDVEIIAPDGKALRCRLLSESGLRMASRLQAATVATATPAAIPPPLAAPAADPDAIFLAAVPAVRRPAAEQLVIRAQAGALPGELATAFGNRQRTTYGAILTLIEQSRNLPPEQAAARLGEADQRRAEAESFARAWRTWILDRG